MKSKKAKLYLKDIANHFSLEYLTHCKIADKRLKTWDIKQDKEYTINPKLNDKLTELYGEKIKEGYVAPLFIKWVNKMVEYGAFADARIQRGEMICEYTGIVEEDTGDEDNLYLWDYPTVMYATLANKKTRKKIKFCIDAQKAGNVARFINHTTRLYQNVGVQIVPAQNLWHVIYIAKKDIKKGEQLLTHYGVDYWRDRQIVPQPIKP